jgi:hypothetical protein
MISLDEKKGSSQALGKLRRKLKQPILYTGMKKVILSADERLIERARLVARSQYKTLNGAFRDWLKQYTERNRGVVPRSMR